MKSKVIIAVVLLLALLSASAGCARGGGKGFVDLMKRVPKDSTSFIFWDVEALGEEVYTVWKEWRDEEEDWLDDMGGIRLDEVEFFSQALIPDLGVVTIVTGDFILDEMEEKLKDDGYSLDRYLGIPMLTKTEDNKEVAVALYKGIITGDKELVEKCIEVVEGERGSPSLYEDRSIKRIADKLPSGVMTGIERNEELYEDLVGLGMSVEKKNEETLKVKAVYKFMVAGAAESEGTLANVKDDLTTMNLAAIKCNCFDPEAKPKGEFIEATASMYIDAFSYYSLAQ